MNACGVDLQPPRLPTWTMRALGDAWAVMASLTKSSTNNTVAEAMEKTGADVGRVDTALSGEKARVERLQQELGETPLLVTVTSDREGSEEFKVARRRDSIEQVQARRDVEPVRAAPRIRTDDVGDVSRAVRELLSLSGRGASRDLHGPDRCRRPDPDGHR